MELKSECASTQFFYHKNNSEGQITFNNVLTA